MRLPALYICQNMSQMIQPLFLGCTGGCVGCTGGCVRLSVKPGRLSLMRHRNYYEINTCNGFIRSSEFSSLLMMFDIFNCVLTRVLKVCHLKQDFIFFVDRSSGTVFPDLPGK